LPLFGFSKPLINHVSPILGEVVNKSWPLLLQTIRSFPNLVYFWRWDIFSTHKTRVHLVALLMLYPKTPSLPPNLSCLGAVEHSKSSSSFCSLSFLGLFRVKFHGRHGKHFLYACKGSPPWSNPPIHGLASFHSVSWERAKTCASPFLLLIVPIHSSRFMTFAYNFKAIIQWKFFISWASLTTPVAWSMNLAF